MPIVGSEERVFWAIILVLIVGYLAGAWLNRQRSKALGQWLQRGLRLLGGKPAWKVVGSLNSGAQVSIADASKPFRSLQITYVLLTREFLPLLAFELLRGKRDTMIVRAELRVRPDREFEVVPLDGPLRRSLDANAGEQPWNWREAPAGLGIATRGEGNDPLVARVTSFLDRYAAYVQRLSLRQRQPNLVLFVYLPGLVRSDSLALLGAVRDLLGG